jgi:hypothetical protein
VHILTDRGFAAAVPDVLSALMRQLWQACSDVLVAAFGLLDDTSTWTTSSISSGPFASIWSTSIRASVGLAVGVFCWQLLRTALVGHSALEVVTSMLRYGLGFTLTAGTVSSLLAASDRTAHLILVHGLQAASFQAAYQPPAHNAMTGTEPIVLGLVGLYGLLPAALGYAVVVIARQVMILVVIAAAPVIALGLTTRRAAGASWTALCWMLTAIGLKPLLAVVLTIGFTPLAQAHGVITALAVAAVLWVGLGSVWTLHTLLNNLISPATPSGPYRTPDSDSMSRNPRAGTSTPRFTTTGVYGRITAALSPGVRMRLAAARAWRSARGAAVPAFAECVSPRSLLDAASDVNTARVLSRLRCHDGPSFRGRGRVCVIHDSIEARWAATAQLTPPAAATFLDPRSAATLADHLAVLPELGQPYSLDRLSLLVRARVGEPYEARQLRRVGHTRGGDETPLSGASRLPDVQHPSGLRYEVFVSVSGPETALGRATMAAGGGLAGRALALYRLLDALDIAASSHESGPLIWLSTSRLADAVRAGCTPTGLAGSPGTQLVDSGSPDTSVERCSPSAYCHGLATTASYRVGRETDDPADVFARLVQLASEVQPGEQRCAVLHVNLAPVTASDTLPRQSCPRPSTTRSAHLVSRSNRDQPGPRRLKGLGTVISEGVARRCCAGVACTVAAPQSLPEHTARLEQDSAGRYALQPEVDQHAAFLATCLPIGIALDEPRAPR